jgi:tetratricopeptide (TPR) repeat protein
MRVIRVNRSLLSFATAAALAVFALVALAQPATLDPNTQTATGTTATLSHGQLPPENIGDALMLHQRYEAAIEAYKKVPVSPIMLNKLGVAYQMMGNLQEAIRCYRTTLKLDPKNVSSMNNLGTIYDSFKDYRHAERMYRKALRLNPASARILRNLGTSLMAQHKYDKGWEAYKDALAKDPNVFADSDSLHVQNSSTVESRGAMNFYMAKGCVRAGENDRAIDYLRRSFIEGFANPHKIESDSEFASLHGVPAFEQLLAAQRNR